MMRSVHSLSGLMSYRQLWDGGEQAISAVTVDSRILFDPFCRSFFSSPPPCRPGRRAQVWSDLRHSPHHSRTEHITIAKAGHRDHAVIGRVIADLQSGALADAGSDEATPTAPGPCLARSRTACAHS